MSLVRSGDSGSGPFASLGPITSTRKDTGAACLVPVPAGATLKTSAAERTPQSTFGSVAAGGAGARVPRWRVDRTVDVTVTGVVSVVGVSVPQPGDPLYPLLEEGAAIRRPQPAIAKDGNRGRTQDIHDKIPQGVHES